METNRLLASLSPSIYLWMNSLGRFPSELNDMIWQDDYESVPRLLRETINGTPWLTVEERQTAYADCAEEFRDIDQYALHRTVRRPEVLFAES